MRKNKYSYLIAKTDNAEMLLEDGKLPIYWDRTVAIERCTLFSNYSVVKVETSKIEDIILGSKIIYTPKK